MPAVASPSPVVDALTPSQSAEIALHGNRALTPILSGAISGGLVGLAWILGTIVWLYKRHRRARRAKAAGFRSYREFLDPPKTQDAFILPPDPAVIKGQARPGERFVVEEEEEGKKGLDLKHLKFKHAKTIPVMHVEEEGRHRGEKEGVPPRMDHRASAPARIPDEGNEPVNEKSSPPPREKS